MALGSNRYVRRTNLRVPDTLRSVRPGRPETSTAGARHPNSLLPNWKVVRFEIWSLVHPA